MKKLTLLLLLSGFASLYGLGLAYHGTLVPSDLPREFKKISADGWVQVGSEISFHNLFERGNKLLLSFNPWRPAGGPAKLRVSVCGEVASEFEVDNSPKTVFLTGECEPRRITFDVLNPFVPSATDTRQLGSQLKSVSITSKAGIPIVSTEIIVRISLFLAALSILNLFAFRRVFVSASILILSIPILAYYYDPKFSKVLPLWYLFASLGIGGVLVRVIGSVDLKKLPSLTQEQAGEVSKRGRWSALVLGLIILGGILRFYGLSFGLPANYHPDEVPKINAIMRMVANGDFNPRYFLHPSLLLYLTYFTNTVFHYFGMEGEFRNTAFLAGRTVSAIAGTLSIGLVYCVGRRLYSGSVGFISALLLAVLPLHVTCSRYMKEDALLLFFMLACIASVLEAVSGGKRKWLIIAGLAAGFAASSKYSGFLSVGFVAISPWLRSGSLKPDRRFLEFLPIALLAAPLAFVCGTPYSVLDYDAFRNGMSIEKHHMLKGHTETITAWSQAWMYHFSRSFLPGMTMVPALLSVSACAVLLFRRKKEDLFLVGLILLFYLPAEWVRAKPAPQPDRYILPCLPFFAIALAELLRILSASSLRLMVAPLLVLSIFFPAYRSITLASEVPDDTRDKMARYMIENLPRGAKIYLDWQPYAPRFWNNEFQMVNDNTKTLMPYLNVNDLKKSGVDYLVLSSLAYDRFFTQPGRKYIRQYLYEQVFENVPIITEFAPRYGTYGFNNPVVTLFSLKSEDFKALESELNQKAKGEISETSNEKRSVRTKKKDS